MSSATVIEQPLPSPGTQSNDGSTDERPISLEWAVAFDVGSAETVQRATEALIAECMHLRGFEYLPAQFVRSAYDSASRVYPQEDWIEQYGYLYRQMVPQLQTPSSPSLSNLDASYQLALNGDSGQQGCGAVAFDQLGLQEWTDSRQYFFSASAELSQAVAVDPRTVSVVTAWSACMASAGFDLETTDEAREIADQVDGGAGGQLGRKIAVTDYSCRRQVRYAETRGDVGRDLTEHWLAAHGQEYSEYLILKENVVARALKAVGP